MRELRIDSSPASEATEGSRRSFLRRLLAGLGGVAALAFGREIANAKNMIDVATQASPAQASPAQNALNSHPRPSYVPKDFAEVKGLSGLPLSNSFEGFGGGADEIVLWYKNPKHVMGFNNPLCIFVSANPRKGLVGTENHQPEVIEITLRSGSTVSTEYHDGMWALDRDGSVKWDTSNVRSIVFRLHQFTCAAPVRSAKTGVHSRDGLPCAREIYAVQQKVEIPSGHHTLLYGGRGNSFHHPNALARIHREVSHGLSSSIP